MRHLIVFIVFSSFLFCCTEKEIETKNKKMIGFKTLYMGEPSNEVLFDKSLNTKKIYVEYFKDIIIVKTLEERNACGSYNTDISFKNSTIILHHDLIPESSLCKSLDVYEITYIIDNPEKIKYSFSKKIDKTLISEKIYNPYKIK